MHSYQLESSFDEGKKVEKNLLQILSSHEETTLIFIEIRR